jgi:uncharacterized membrane protein YkvA (DUF1232 family)
MVRAAWMEKIVTQTIECELTETDTVTGGIISNIVGSLIVAREAVLANCDRKTLWRKTVQVAAQLPFAEDLLAAYHCAFDRATPAHVKAALVSALACLVLRRDDGALLRAAVQKFADHMRPEHRDAARATLAHMKEQS